MRKKLFFIFIGLCGFNFANTQSIPCSNPIYRQFDFWIGEWEVFGKNGVKAGDSKISVILDSCIILEEWANYGFQQGFSFKGKSFNTYNRAAKQWQQTWVDNTGTTTNFNIGKFDNNRLTFISNPFKITKDSFAIRRLSFYKLSDELVRQHGEISKDSGRNYITEYDLEYRKKHFNVNKIVDSLFNKMITAYNTKQYGIIANYYCKNAKIISKTEQVADFQNIVKYWNGFEKLAGKWELQNLKSELINGLIWQKGKSIITDKNNKKHTVDFTLIIVMENNEWKILQDAYW